MKNMDEKPLFSIIMPIYNAEKFLEKAIMSILNQTFQNFELILIDDCSTDRSCEICKIYACKNNRVLFKQTTHNAGVATARNEGMKWVHGQYMSFVDSDDYIDDTVLEIVYNDLLKRPVQVLKYGCIEEYYNNAGKVRGTKRVNLDKGYYNDPYLIKKHILKMEKLPLFGYVWNTFYDFSFLKKINVLFDPKFKVNEDFMFNMDVFSSVQTFTCLDNCGYHYAKRVNNSLSTKSNESYYSLHMAKIQKMLDKYEEWQMLTDLIIMDIFWLYTRCIYSYISRVMLESDFLRSKETLGKVFSSILFYRYEKVYFRDRSLKEMILINILQNERTILIITCCAMINVAKNNFGFLFSKAKE